ncbi:MAG: hypothetical protein LBF89_04915 [Bacteroidales bacterium]|jgi:Spy/CpxP family protein refolding chaperone|nr:hypothetical protein [Bacteroidales bacterium]
MKKIMIMMALMTVTAVVSIAQPQARQRTTPEERAKIQTERLDTLLQLTEVQKTKILDVNTGLAKKQDELFRNNSDNREAMRSKMQEFETERENSYKEILTKEQFEKYSKDREQLRARRQGNRQGAPNEGRQGNRQGQGRRN